MARRAVSIPLVFGLAVIVWGGLLVWLAIVALFDLVARAWRFPRVRALSFFALYLACEVVGVTVAVLIGVLTFGGRLVGPQRYRQLNAGLQRAWCSALLRGSLRIFSMRTAFEGLDAVVPGPVVVMVRHTSTADTVLAAALLSGPELNLRYVLKRELLWDPCLDVVGHRLPNAFIDRTGIKTGENIAAIRALADELGPSEGVLIYPEGTRFSCAKLLQRRRMLRDGDDARIAELAESFEHVLPPKSGGSVALLEQAPSADVVILEHTGFEGAATFGDFWHGGLVDGLLRVRVRRIPRDEIPTDDYVGWLYDQWAQIDAWVAEVRGSAREER